MHECTEKRFLKDVEDHQIRIIHDEGVHRCIRFSDSKNSFNMHFTLTTWPGHLAISGDMGTFVFTRLDDMFEFFRHKEFGINPQYWAEKCEAADRRTGGIDEFKREKFEAKVNELFEEHEFESEEAKENCKLALRDDVLRAENEYEAYDYMANFKEYGFQFTDYWEYRFREYTYHYIWCCYAIAWGIKRYDEAKA